MTDTTWLITGSNRGIGLGLARQLLQEPTNTVFATCRTPSAAKDLSDLASSPGKLHIVKIDVADEASIKAGADDVFRLLNGAGLDYVVNNAGILLSRTDRAFDFDPTDLIKSVTTNVIGPALVSRHLLPAIERSNRKVVANVSSGLGSVTRDGGGHMASYSISKAALNMLTYKQSRERPDLIVVALDPGWVKDDMGGPDADVEVDESASGLLRVLRGLTRESTGKCFEHTGQQVPW